jgi:Fe-S-cluster containining protein
VQAPEATATMPTKPLTLDEIYARIPPIACQRLCNAACSRLPMSPGEADRLHRRGLPVLRQAPTEFVVAHRDGRCVALRDGACTVYEDRHLICRFIGVVEGMECRWGCRPERFLTRQEAAELLRAAWDAW